MNKSMSVQKRRKSDKNAKKASRKMNCKGDNKYTEQTGNACKANLFTGGRRKYIRKKIDEGS